MDVMRVVDAFCASCNEVCEHSILTEDPGACYCNQCGSAQPLMIPLQEPAGGSVVETESVAAAM